MDFFNSLIKFVEILFDFVSNIVSGLMNMIAVLGSVITLPSLFTGILFPSIVTSMTIVLSIGVLYKIIGR